MIRILSTVIIKKFYERNAGFFLFLFFFLFGIVESSQIVNFHLSLIYGMIGSPLFLAIVGSLWLLYMGKCILFINQVLGLPENSFLKSLNLLGKRNQFFYLLFAIAMIYLPVMAYSLIVVFIAIYTKSIIVASIIIAFQAIIIGSSTSIVQVWINDTRTPFQIFPNYRWPWAKPMWWYYINQLTSNLKMVLFVTKVFSIGAILLFMQIKLDQYDYRVALLGLIFGLAGHMVVIFEFRKFEDQLTFIRALPLTLIQRFSKIAFAYGVILLPEIIILGVNHIHLIDILLIYIAGCSFLLFAHCSTYAGPLNMDKHTKTILMLFLLGFGVILFKLAIPVSVILILVAYSKYVGSFYNYEPG